MIEAELPDGTILEFPDNTSNDVVQATVKKTLGLQQQPTAQPQEQELSLSQGIAQDLSARGQEFSKIQSNVASGETSPESGVLQTIGNVGAGAIGDVGGRVIGKGLDLLNKIVPESYDKATQKSLESVANTPIGKAGIKAAQSGMDAWKEFETQYPDVANNLRAVGNIASIIPAERVLKAGASAVGEQAIKKGSEAVESGLKATKKLETSVKASKKNFIRELILPTDAIKQEERKVLIGKYKTKVPLLTKEEKQSVKYLSEINDIKPNMLAEEARQVVKKKIGEEGKLLKDRLSKENYTFEREVDLNKKIPSDIPNDKIDIISSTEGKYNEFNAALDTEVKKLDRNVTLTGDARKVANELVDKFKEFVEQNPKTLDGLWSARKQYDKWVEDSKPKIFDQKAETGLTAANRTIRDSVHGFIESKTTDKYFKGQMKKMSALYDAYDEISAKAMKEPKTAPARLYKKVEPFVNTKNALTTIAGIAGLGGLGLLLPVAKVAAGVGAVGYGGYKAIKAGKKAIPVVDKTVGKGLQKVGKGLKYTSNLLP